MPGQTLKLSGACILQVIPALEAGGAERTVLEVAEGIIGAGGRVLVASEGGRLVPALTGLGGAHVTLPMASKNPLVWARTRAALATLVRTEGVDIVHARSRAPAWPALWASRRTGASFVTTYHGAYSGKSTAKLLYNSVMARGDVVIANSRFTESAIREAFADWRFMQGRRIVTIPRGAALGDFDPGAVTPDRLTAAFDVLGGEDRFRILLPGRLTPWKGQAVLIEAARQLQERGLTLRLALLGSPQGHEDYERMLNATIEQAGLSDAVVMPGEWDDMPAAYAWADVAVSASTRPEAFGRVALEAMAMARPVVATDHGGSRETVLPEETGILVEPGQAAPLADALLRLAKEPALGARLSAAGRQRAAQFSTAAMVEATLGVYRDVLEARERKA
ncbi:glycosyltransferase family 4 protein [Parvularcula dongshanensis]|uniref:Glycosyltransferase involved in cell wall biosynthesis n=1 Tax=Parvularcula dongshanensis TaxID=1173995 RepID=A0A840I1H3_9PROT|nr:glycosyltransferase family 4 protein [Parvularcula dongshanensis]MBB4658597.1 glycosyltransferase involved in cell wall biosynthesis [Parvularcula dongshanensis]